MPDIVSPPIIFLTAAGSLAVAGVNTGLDPVMLGLGAFGGYWAVWRGGPMSWIDRTSIVLLSSIVAAYSAGIIARQAAELNLVAAPSEPALAYLAALLVGRLAMPVLEKTLLDVAKAAGQAVVRWFDKLWSGQ
ncbi:MAG: hypothetical protein Q7J47_03385 [Azoarcus sp.]|nr:hypothetical protein [Azoarcus sp.]